MRRDWANNRNELLAFWRSGKSSVIFPDNLPWVFIAHGSADTPPWAVVHLEWPHAASR